MRILLAEDDRIISQGLIAALRKSGYAVDHVNNGADADTALLSQPYDLLILDLGLPRLSGIEVLKRLRGRKVTTPVLVLTAQDGIEDRVRGLDAGADDYLTKPFRPARTVRPGARADPARHRQPDPDRGRRPVL
jgi:two-component system OmpR family response regulator